MAKRPPSLKTLQRMANTVARAASVVDVKTNYRLGRRRKSWWFEVSCFASLTTDVTLKEAATALRRKFASKGYKTFKATPMCHPGLTVTSKVYNGFSVRAQAVKEFDVVFLFDAIGDQ